MDDKRRWRSHIALIKFCRMTPRTEKGAHEIGSLNGALTRLNWVENLPSNWDQFCATPTIKFGPIPNVCVRVVSNSFKNEIASISQSNHRQSELSLVNIFETYICKLGSTALEALNTINYTSNTHSIASNSVDIYIYFWQTKLIFSKIYTVRPDHNLRIPIIWIIC